MERSRPEIRSIIILRLRSTIYDPFLILSIKAIVFHKLKKVGYFAVYFCFAMIVLIQKIQNDGFTYGVLK